MALSCLIEKSKINTLNYSKEELREYSDKRILKCDCCDSTMIYKHGDYKIPHFAHINSECRLGYSEPETEEHMNGKLVIYNFLKTQNVENLELEKWIPETKQRPDIYFEFNGEKFVVEFQCTPIATEFNDRRKLYELSGIKDIWILGYNNYGFTNCSIRDFNHVYGYKTKVIERELFSKNKYVLHLRGKNIIGYTNSGYKKTTDVVETSFDLFAFNLFDIDIKEFIESLTWGNINRNIIHLSKFHNKKVYSQYYNFLEYKKIAVKHKKLIERISDENNSCKVTMCEYKTFYKFQLEINSNTNIILTEFKDIDRLIKNKTMPYKIKNGNYIYGDKIVVIDNCDKRTFWNWDRKKHKRLPSDSYYHSKKVYSTDNITLEDLIKED